MVCLFITYSSSAAKNESQMFILKGANFFTFVRHPDDKIFPPPYKAIFKPYS
jgi:hypothetical protein